MAEDVAKEVLSGYLAFWTPLSVEGEHIKEWLCDSAEQCSLLFKLAILT